MPRPLYRIPSLSLSRPCPDTPGTNDKGRKGFAGWPVEVQQWPCRNLSLPVQSILLAHVPDESESDFLKRQRLCETPRPRSSPWRNLSCPARRKLMRGREVKSSIFGFARRKTQACTLNYALEARVSNLTA